VLGSLPAGAEGAGKRQHPLAQGSSQIATLRPINTDGSRWLICFRMLSAVHGRTDFNWRPQRKGLWPGRPRRRIEERVLESTQVRDRWRSLSRAGAPKRKRFGNGERAQGSSNSPWCSPVPDPVPGHDRLGMACAAHRHDELCPRGRQGRGCRRNRGHNHANGGRQVGRRTDNLDVWSPALWVHLEPTLKSTSPRATASSPRWGT
jgi:hypothetical protein